MTEKKYVCPVCGTKAVLKPEDPVPICCGAEMIPEPLPFCSGPVAAEAARTGREDEPCADGVTPSKKS